MPLNRTMSFGEYTGMIFNDNINVLEEFIRYVWEEKVDGGVEDVGCLIPSHPSQYMARLMTIEDVGCLPSSLLPRPVHGQAHDS